MLSLSKHEELMSGHEIYVEFVIQGNVIKATAIDAKTGIEASIIGPAGAPREPLAQAALRKLKYVMEKQKD
jgi:hypothetical protein